MRTIADKMAKRMSKEERAVHMKLCGLLEEEETTLWKNLQAAATELVVARDGKDAGDLVAAINGRAMAVAIYDDIARIRRAMEPSTWKLDD